uniref:Uncharacterized protein n=1 Tax=Anguilla anguilla TaxID=7936 RepID=A0A0E9VAX9_ANGAN
MLIWSIVQPLLPSGLPTLMHNIVHIRILDIKNGSLTSFFK